MSFYFASKPNFFYKKGIYMLLKRWQLIINIEGKYAIVHNLKISIQEILKNKSLAIYMTFGILLL